MKKICSIALAIGTLAVSSLVRADTGWTEYALVAELVPTSRHYYEVRLSTKKNPSGCKNGDWFYQDYSSVGADNMFRVILEGLSSERWLRVYVTGKCNINGYSEISAVSILMK